METKRKRSKSKKSSRSSSKKKNKSRSSSKYRSYSNEKNFFFKQKSVFLTYPHIENTGITKEDIGYYLKDTFKCSVTIVCLEHHQDGNPHIHCWLEFEDVLYTKNVAIFDYKGKHPNIGCMKDNKKNTRENVLNYMMKEDDKLL